ncbi:MAG: helix-turn-helix transcriptional regulator [Gammaproteobacteria bacterium]
MAHRLSIEAICRLIETLLPGGYPGIEEVAQLLQVSPRTLQRKLSEAGSSYSGLVERCRCRVACESLRYTQDPVQDIAALLGYRDVSSFSRAFRRWTGITPRDFRNRRRGGLA